MTNLESAAVQRVISFLDKAGAEGHVIELAETARSAEDAAKSIGVDVGSIVKSLVFSIDGKPAMALISGNSMCNIQKLHTIFGLNNPAQSVDAAFVKKYTGFSIGGVAPVAHLHQIPIVIDTNLGHFPTIYAAAGHPHCVFSTNLRELRCLTGGLLSDRIVLITSK